ncbi:COP9 signalosome catalytic subunit RRI1 KNAG_0L02300 [Huiozyma naganishii CBS 8797]|uniref:COP9 signalosome complex subunit 5 n=1 Tax=Huiozyma naganishii (strain ATCC MYA-139 / BCRC 22969 / CBS 8797 / KCTC 17520 / NBRC 10181 / NCYC 3082 / Yp74L-3) TaxID=1071383 RepID=J7SB88_HUIN7|nr:hypothetical protein KNAG_0L02300 [Kazachstania naganishii CBS 8797]CCK72846.1 hypothetical protein KNAG_0L02300 [Kazachstania naganishii CBS 8797]
MQKCLHFPLTQILLNMYIYFLFYYDESSTFLMYDLFAGKRTANMPKLSQHSISDLQKLVKEVTSASVGGPSAERPPIFRSTTTVSEQGGDCTKLLNRSPLAQDEIIRHCVSERGTDDGTMMGKQFHYNSVLVSQLALSQILRHSIEGGDIEIMGLLVGTTVGSQFIITQSFALPVLGTETRVNAQAESYEYMVKYVSEFVPSQGLVKVVGWYHSHPGYDCWLSSIDMRTQDLNQSYQDPYLAVVVDPKKSVKEGTISVGAFRTTKIANGDEQGELNYYPLKMTVFDSSLGRLSRSLKSLFRANFTYGEEGAASLLDKLISIMKQMKEVRELNKQETVSGQEQEPRQKRDQESNDGHREVLNSTASNDEISRRPSDTRSSSYVSMNSANDGSDIEMGDCERDTVSRTSSVNTVNESALPLLRSTYHQQHTSSQTRTREDLCTATPPRSNVLQHPMLRHAMANTTHSTDKIALSIDRGHTLTSFEKAKREAINAKVLQYMKLRLYRDTFTL